MTVQSINLNSDNPKCESTDAFDRWLREILDKLERNQQRCLLSCEGTDLWCSKIYETVRLQCDNQILLSDRAGQKDALAFAKSETLLGQEAAIVIVDLYGGLNPDVLCIAAGLVKCGGLLILMSPGGEKWSEVRDSYGIWQDGRISADKVFVDYIFDRIRAGANACIQIRQGSDLPDMPSIEMANPTEMLAGKTGDQVTVLNGIKVWLSQSKQRIALITAHRGRGKSTCMGFMVKQMIEEYGFLVCVTAYSRQSASMLLEQCDTANFSAPDALILNQTNADVLVIDEAAMLPFPMLDQLCRQFKRVVMTTTTAGYEGTGQGFLLRFIARLQKEEFLWLQLSQPVRWSANDCLEDWIDDTMLLNQGPISDDELESSVDIGRCRNRVIDRYSDIKVLIRIYQLMVSAHYRTRPSDLRALMENPDLVPIVAETNEKITGLALLNHEGGFDPALCEQVFLGQRRPKGHLLAQMLTAQAGSRKFAGYRGLRIQRIAVTENRRRLGIGRNLIEFVESYASKNGYAYIGASFAFDSESAGFWKSCGFRLVHVGYGRGKSSGNHSVAVIKVLEPAVENDVDQLAEKLRSGLPQGLCQRLRHMNADDVVTLLRFSGYTYQETDIERDEIEAFTQGNKGFELCFVTLQRAVMLAIAQLPEGQPVNSWLIEKVIQNRQWNVLSPQRGCYGRKSVENKIRRLVDELLPSSVDRRMSGQDYV